MAEVRLPSIRRGFAYTATLTFPIGFLTELESVRASLRSYAGQPLPSAVFTDNRDGHNVTLSLSKEQTADLEPGDYLTEAVIYVPTVPATPEIPLVDNLYIVEVAHSASA